MTAIASLLSTTAVPLTATPPGASGATLVPFPELTLAAGLGTLDPVPQPTVVAAPVGRQAVAGTGNALPPAPSDDAALTWLGVDAAAIAMPSEITTHAAGPDTPRGGSKPGDATLPLAAPSATGLTITPTRHAAAAVGPETRRPDAALSIGQAVAQWGEGARDTMPVASEDADAVVTGTADARTSETIIQPTASAPIAAAPVIADLGAAAVQPLAEHRDNVTATPDATIEARLAASPRVGVVPTTGSVVRPANTGVVKRPAAFFPGTDPATPEQVEASVPQRSDVPGSAPSPDAAAPIIAPRAAAPVAATFPATGGAAVSLPTHAQDVTSPPGIAVTQAPHASRFSDAPVDTAVAPARFRTKDGVTSATVRSAAPVVAEGDRAVTTVPAAPSGRLLPPGTVPASDPPATASIAAPITTADLIVPPAKVPTGGAAMPAAITTPGAASLGVPWEVTMAPGPVPLTVPDRAVSSDPLPVRLPIAAPTSAVSASVPKTTVLVADIAAPAIDDVSDLIMASVRATDRPVDLVLPRDAGAQTPIVGIVTPAAPAPSNVQGRLVPPFASAPLTPVAIAGAPRPIALNSSPAPAVAGVRPIATLAFTVTNEVSTSIAATAPVSPPAATSLNDAPVAGDGAVRATGFAMRTAEPALRPLGSIALPPAPPAPVTTSAPAAQVFAAAIHRALGEQDARQPGDVVPASAVTAPVLAGITATGGAQHGALDLRQEHWPAAMIERIVSLRDMAAENDTRLRLAPDMLGTIDVSLKRDGDQVQVQITAEQAQTRAMLADAQPRLIELADARGVKLQVSGGQAGGAGQQPGPGNNGGGDAPRQQTPGTPLPTRPRSAERAADDTDQRIA